jgi:hypothetical protein
MIVPLILPSLTFPHMQYVSYFFSLSFPPSPTPPPPREFSCVLAIPAGSSKVILCLRGGRRGERAQLPPSPPLPPPSHVNFQLFLPDHPPPRPPPIRQRRGGGAEGEWG